MVTRGNGDRNIFAVACTAITFLEHNAKEHKDEEHKGEEHKDEEHKDENADETPKPSLRGEGPTELPEAGWRHNWPEWPVPNDNKDFDRATRLAMMLGKGKDSKDAEGTDEDAPADSSEPVDMRTLKFNAAFYKLAYDTPADEEQPGSPRRGTSTEQNKYAFHIDTPEGFTTTTTLTDKDGRVTYNEEKVHRSSENFKPTKSAAEATIKFEHGNGKYEVSELHIALTAPEKPPTISFRGREVTVVEADRYDLFFDLREEDGKLSLEYSNTRNGEKIRLGEVPLKPVA